jgi:hypothetical protein
MTPFLFDVLNRSNEKFVETKYVPIKMISPFHVRQIKTPHILGFFYNQESEVGPHNVTLSK